MAGGNIREMGAGDSGDTITREGGKKLGNMEEDGFCAVRLSGVAQVLEPRRQVTHS